MRGSPGIAVRLICTRLAAARAAPAARSAAAAASPCVDGSPRSETSAPSEMLRRSRTTGRDSDARRPLLAREPLAELVEQALARLVALAGQGGFQVGDQGRAEGRVRLGAGDDFVEFCASERQLPRG